MNPGMGRVPPGTVAKADAGMPAAGDVRQACSQPTAATMALAPAHSFHTDPRRSLPLSQCPITARSRGADRGFGCVRTQFEFPLHPEVATALPDAARVRFVGMSRLHDRGKPSPTPCAKPAQDRLQGLMVKSHNSWGRISRPMGSPVLKAIFAELFLASSPPLRARGAAEGDGTTDHLCPAWSLLA